MTEINVKDLLKRCGNPSGLLTPDRANKRNYNKLRTCIAYTLLPAVETASERKLFRKQHEQRQKQVDSMLNDLKAEYGTPATNPKLLPPDYYQAGIDYIRDKHGDFKWEEKTVEEAVSKEYKVWWIPSGKTDQEIRETEVLKV
jgi:hypothetical protein